MNKLKQIRKLASIITNPKQTECTNIKPQKKCHPSLQPLQLSYLVNISKIVRIKKISDWSIIGYHIQDSSIITKVKHRKIIRKYCSFNSIILRSYQSMVNNPQGLNLSIAHHLPKPKKPRIINDVRQGKR